MTKTSAYARWFKEQYGSLPNNRKRYDLRDRVFATRSKLHELEAALSLEERLHDRYNAALYGWNARSPQS